MWLLWHDGNSNTPSLTCPISMAGFRLVPTSITMSVRMFWKTGQKGKSASISGTGPPWSRVRRSIQTLIHIIISQLNFSYWLLIWVHSNSNSKELTAVFLKGPMDPVNINSKILVSVVSAEHNQLGQIVIKLKLLSFYFLSFFSRSLQYYFLMINSIPGCFYTFMPTQCCYLLLKQIQ